MRVIWAPLSLRRIQEIADYIAADNPSAANDWIDSVFQKVDVLKRNPETGRIVPEIDRSNIRELIYGNYRIIYLYFPKLISILTVRHFKQILPLRDILQ